MKCSSKVLYNKKGESTINKLPIEGEKEYANRIAYYIKIAEDIDGPMKVLIFDNKTGLLFDDQDMIPKDSFLQYEVMTPAEYKIMQDKKIAAS